MVCKKKATAAPLTSSRSFASAKDIEHLTERLLQEKPPHIDEKELSNDVKANFEAYPRRKLHTSEVDLNRRHLKDPALRYTTIKQGADYNRSLEKVNSLSIDYKALFQQKKRKLA